MTHAQSSTKTGANQWRCQLFIRVSYQSYLLFIGKKICPQIYIFFIRFCKHHRLISSKLCLVLVWLPLAANRKEKHTLNWFLLFPTERVFCAWWDTNKPSPKDKQPKIIEESRAALGICAMTNRTVRQKRSKWKVSWCICDTWMRIVRLGSVLTFLTRTTSAFVLSWGECCSPDRGKTQLLCVQVFTVNSQIKVRMS